jgi:NTE family protein
MQHKPGVAMARTEARRTRATAAVPAPQPTPFSQTVLVLQGGGALGAYQVGVYQALHERGIEPDWVIGTSIGAINGALIAGNTPENRLKRLHDFWDRVEHGSAIDERGWWPGLGNFFTNLQTVTRGIPSFFTPNPNSWRGPQAMLGVEEAAYYRTAPLRKTLGDLVDFDHLALCRTRLTVGAVNVRTGQMTYFDSRECRLAAEHVMASGALPPAFPAVRVDGDPYWDGGVYSNTPIEAVLDDKPRRNSLIFSVNLWQPAGPEPESIWQVMGRQKDIQYASRADSHIAKQKQIHHLRHIIRELAREMPEALRESTRVKDLASWGCGTTMHVVRLLAPHLDGEDHTKDIDFTPAGVRARWQAGYADTLRALDRAPWKNGADPMDGVVVHEMHD